MAKARVKFVYVVTNTWDFGVERFEGVYLTLEKAMQSVTSNFGNKPTMEQVDENTWREKGNPSYGNYITKTIVES